MEKVAFIVGVAIVVVIGPQRAAEAMMNNGHNHALVEQSSVTTGEL